MSNSVDDMATPAIIKLGQRPKTRGQNNLILAYATQGLTAAEIAAKLNVSTRKVARGMAQARPALKAIDDIQSRARVVIEKQLPSERRVERYVALATSAQVEAVQYSSLKRLDDIDGLVVDADRMRYSKDAERTVTPMFSLPAGTFINVTVNQPASHPGSPEVCASSIIDVTPEPESDTTI